MKVLKIYQRQILNYQSQLWTKPDAELKITHQGINVTTMVARGRTVQWAICAPT